MAVAQVYNAVPNDVITAARWNNEFGNIYDNGTDIAFPLTKGVSCAGYTVTLDSAGVVTLTGTSGVAVLVGSLNVSGSINKGSILAGKPIGGLTYAPAADAANDITVAVGEAASSDATLADRRLIVLASAMTGRIDGGTWVVGTNQPKLDTGTVTDAKYYIYLISTATGTVDILFSESGTAPTMPATYTFKRLIGWFNRVGGSNLPFTTIELPGGGLEFYYTTPINDVDTNALTTSRRTDTLSVPITFAVHVKLRVLCDDTALYSVIITCPDETDAAPNPTGQPGLNLQSHIADLVGGNEIEVRTSATGTVASRALANTMDSFDINTVSFKWSRR